MNFWQSQMLVNSLKNKYFDINAQTDVIYSWLPSVTELSRQAIFLGKYPSVSYQQSSSSESRMWENFWLSKGFIIATKFFMNTVLRLP